MEVRKLSCPSCGGQLDPASNASITRCPYCDSALEFDSATKKGGRNIDIARTYMSFGDFKKANAILEEIIDENPNIKESWFLRGLCLFSDYEGHWDAMKLVIHSNLSDTNMLELIDACVEKSEELGYIYDLIPGISDVFRHSTDNPEYLKTCCLLIDDITQSVFSRTNVIAPDDIVKREESGTIIKAFSERTREGFLKIVAELRDLTMKTGEFRIWKFRHLEPRVFGGFKDRYEKISAAKIGIGAFYANHVDSKGRFLNIYETGKELDPYYMDVVNMDDTLDMLINSYVENHLDDSCSSLSALPYHIAAFDYQQFEPIREFIKKSQ
ncbi:MAG: hypothetical protein WC891_07940 [Actinomycetota bacterium]